MNKRGSCKPSIETLESRRLLSVAPHGVEFGHVPGLHVPKNPDAAVQADLKQLTTDEQALAADQKKLAPTIQKDLQAIHTAIKALDTKLAPLRTQLQTAEKAVFTDLRAIFKDRITLNTTQLTKDQATLKTDQATVQSIEKQIHDTISNDPAVQAAQKQLQTDAAPIVADRQKISSDLTQLRKDIQAQVGGGTTGKT